MEHSRHVLRALFVLLLALVAFVFGRTLLVPKSYGLYGSYRFDNVAEQANVRPPLHGGAAACADCHDDRAKAWTAGAHKKVSCEICHAPLGRHVKDGSFVAAMPIDRAPGVCLRCHRKVEGRPASFPQIVPAQHADEATQGRACLACHDPHSPKP